MIWAPHSTSTASVQHQLQRMQPIEELRQMRLHCLLKYHTNTNQSGNQSVSERIEAIMHLKGDVVTLLELLRVQRQLQRMQPTEELRQMCLHRLLK